MFLGLFVGLSLYTLIEGMEETALLERMIMFISEVVILLPVLFVLGQRRISILVLIPRRQISAVTMAMAVIFISGVIGMVSIFEVLILPHFPLPEFLQQMDEDLLSGGLAATTLLVLAAVVVAPVVEEVLFRGILQQSLFYQYGSLLPALVIPTVIFALFHVGYLFYFPAMVELLVLGILLAWLMAKTGNILIPMLTHALFNLSSFSGFSMGLDESSTLADLGLTWILLSVIFTAVGWIYFKNRKLVFNDEVYLIPLPQEADE